MGTGSVIGIIQARLGSARLPGKILAPIGSRPLLSLLTQRLRRSQVTEWWLATTREPADDVTAAWGRAMGLRVLRGATDDVLSRFCDVLRVREKRTDWVLRVTADDPFIDAGVVDLLLAARHDCDAGTDLVELADAEKALPTGYAPKLVRAEALLRAEREIPPDQPFHRAHVVSWITLRQPACEVAIPEDWPRRPDWRWTVDTADDLAMASHAFALFSGREARIDYASMTRELDAHPEIPSMNLHVRQRALEEG